MKRSFAMPLVRHAEDLSGESAWLSRVLLKIADCALRERGVYGCLAKSRIEHKAMNWWTVGEDSEQHFFWWRKSLAFSALDADCSTQDKAHYLTKLAASLSRGEARAKGTKTRKSARTLTVAGCQA